MPEAARQVPVGAVYDRAFFLESMKYARSVLQRLRAIALALRGPRLQFGKRENVERT
jgi:hypothetical protein